MQLITLGKSVSQARIFRGAAARPFLAPRGVFVAGSKLFVADTGQNRVFVWSAIPTGEFADPQVILGQQALTAVGRNAAGAVGADTLHYPSGVWSDGQRLIVADAWNHRVLIWQQLPKHHAQPADVVLGQPDFTSNQPNVKGIGTAPDARTLNWPYGVFSDGQRLWIADTGNRRVLFYDEIPDKNFTPATAVIGKTGFTSRDYQNHEPVWPYAVKVRPDGAMAVADTQFYRVLLWYDYRQAFSRPADVIIGQPDFDSCGQNQYGLTPAAHTLNWTYDACFYREGLLVNDTGNSRILYFAQLPEKNNQPADVVIGRPDFTTGSEYSETLLGTDKALYWPFAIITSGNKLIIADTGNHRLVLATLHI